MSIQRTIGDLAVDTRAVSPIPVNRPLLPSFERLAPYLRKIDEARYYTNYGQLHDLLRTRLAGHYGIGQERLAIANSGTAALIGAIFATAGRATPDRPLCICPSYTFVATAVAANACGYTPFLVDIDASTWACDPRHIAQLSELERAGLVIAVCPYGQMVDVAAWQAFSDLTGVPVVIDAAACFDTLNPADIATTRIPIAISLHATKTFSTAEGGLILSGDEEVILRAGRALNFGFHNNRESAGPSINGKLSEYHAAIGLAELDGWAEKRTAFLRVARTYRDAAAKSGLAGRIITGCDQANSYALFCAELAAEAARVCRSLEASGIEYRSWYGRGLHNQPEYRNCPHGVLPATEGLAQRIVGLPVATDMHDFAIARIVAAVSNSTFPT